MGPTVHDFAVDGETLSWLNADDVSGDQRVERDRASFPVLHAAGLVGSQLHECSDGAPGAAERIVLQRVPEGEQEEQGRTFQPMADHARAGRREQHEQVDVERGVPQCLESPSAGLPSAGGVCEQQQGQ